jgi:hypothetical protein
MNKLEAITRTAKRFTNLIDNGIIPSATVIDIIVYYDNLLDKSKAEIQYESGIERNFAEEEIKQKYDEEDYY